MIRFNKENGRDGDRTTLSGDFCIYCGNPAQSIEHFPPKVSSRNGWLFPCCLECNLTASTNYPFDLTSRVAFVKFKLKLKYQAVLKVGNWTEKELLELGDKLQRSTRCFLIKKKEILDRLSWDFEAYLEYIGIDYIALSKELMEIRAISQAMNRSKITSVDKEFITIKMPVNEWKLITQALKL